MTGPVEIRPVAGLPEIGAGDRMRREGFVHHGIELRFEGRGHRIDLHELTGGRAITLYPQHEVLKDLIKLRLDAGGQIFFESAAEHLLDIETQAPKIALTTAEGRTPEARPNRPSPCRPRAELERGGGVDFIRRPRARDAAMPRPGRRGRGR